uniref:F-box protein CPR1-like n=1 Tax=Erigeron canadensis TaxID=72917 RepID=UPI001CB909F0|nr:F-box protein CPR1-like [Erigeron canadensis]
MSDVPMLPDVLSQILCWLPVKSLLRLRSVSKTFRNLIDSNYLINLHLNLSIKTRQNINILFGGDRTLCYFNLDSSNNAVNKIDNPLYFAIFETVVLGSCNGVVCLCTTEPDTEIAVWNPVVRKFKKTRLGPAKSLKGVGRGFCIKGFGYDCVGDDYKVVRLVQYFSSNLRSEVVYSTIEVFSLKADAWREVGGFPYFICYFKNFNAFANGALHWLVSESPETRLDVLIVAFDLTTDELRMVPRPDIGNDRVKVSLAILGGCLSLVCNYPKKNVDIWVMESYGVKDTWSKLISSTDVKLVMDLDCLRPVVYSKSGDEVLLEKNFERLYWYNLENKTVKRFKVAGMPRLFVTEVFTGSLFQVNIGCASEARKKKEKIENQNEKKKDDFLSKGFRLVL